jgi:hypothetical protein
MPFWLNDNRFVLISRRLLWPSRLAVSLLFLFIFSGTWFFLFYFPLIQKSRLNDYLLNDLNNAINNCEAVLDKSDVISKSKSAATKSFSNTVSRLKSKNESIDFLFDKLEEHGLYCESFNPMEKKDLASVEKEYFYLKASGSFRHVASFCDDFTKNHCVMKFKQLRISRLKKRRVELEGIVRFFGVKNETRFKEI